MGRSKITNFKDMKVQYPERYDVIETDGTIKEKEIKFKPGTIFQEGTPEKAEYFNNIQSNCVYEVEGVRVVEGAQEIYDITIEGSEDFVFSNLKLAFKTTETNTKKAPVLRLNNLTYVLKNFLDTIDIGDITPNEKILINLDFTLKTAELLGVQSGGDTRSMKEKMTVVENVEKLKLLKGKIGDVIEVLGYYTAGDGAGHPRKASNADDGSGVLGANGLWWNVVHNGEVNVSWFGAKGDGVSVDTLVIQKALDYLDSGTVFFGKGEFVTESLNFKNRVSLKGLNKNIGNSTNKATIIKHIGAGHILKNVSEPLKYNYDLNIEGFLLLPEDGFTDSGIVIENCNSANLKNLTFRGAFKDSAISYRGAILFNLERIRILSGTVAKTPYAVKALKYVGIESTAVNFNEVYIGGLLDYVEGKGIDYGFYFEYGSCYHGSVNDCTVESMNRSAVFLERGNTLQVNNLYVENVPNKDIALPIFEIGTVGATDLEGQKFDGRTSIIIRGGVYQGRIQEQLSTKTIFLKSDLARYVVIEDTPISRVDKFVVGTSKTQLLKVESTHCDAPNIVEGINSTKMFFGKGNIFVQGKVDESNSYFTITDYTPIQKQYFYDGQLIVNKNKSSQYFDSLRKFDYSTGKFIPVNEKLPSPPNVGYYNRGDIVFNSSALEGRNVGWICTTSGEPGVWEKFGQIGYYKFVGETPIGVYTPNFIGEEVMAQNSKVWYKSTGVTNKDWCAISIPVVTMLNNPYYAKKMQQEGILEEYYQYLDDKNAYDQQQREIETQRQLAFENRENKEQTYEGWLSTQPMMLPVETEPQPSEKVLDFAKRYLG